MTTIFTANLGDYIILASDNRITAQYCQNGESQVEFFVSDTYKKMVPYASGVYVSSGNVIYTSYFIKHLCLMTDTGIVDLEKIVYAAIDDYNNNESSASLNNTLIYFTANIEGRLKVFVLHVAVEDAIWYEIEPLQMTYSVFVNHDTEDTLEYVNNMTRQLRRLAKLKSEKDVLHHCQDLVKQFFKRQYLVDYSISSTFDFCIFNTTTCRGQRTNLSLDDILGDQRRRDYAFGEAFSDFEDSTLVSLNNNIRDSSNAKTRAYLEQKVLTLNSEEFPMIESDEVKQIV